MDKATHIWIITDGKPGHFNQSLGLVEALQRRIANLTWQKVPAMSLWQSFRFALKHKRDRMPPKLVIGTGHQTHITLLLLSKLIAIPSVVLMKPSLPLKWFDLAIIPEHDSPKARDNTIVSKGALNRVNTGVKKRGTGLFLIGGASKHFGCDTQVLFETIKSISEKNPINWTLTTSRRTPSDTLETLRSITNIDVIPFTETDNNWLPEILAKTEICWVTEDSVSMIYEALTAGCQVGLIEMPHIRENRLTAGIDALKKAGYLMPFSQRGITPPILAEADRCAALVEHRFLV